jgi:glucose uptake protein GlcU
MSLSFGILFVTTVICIFYWVVTCSKPVFRPAEVLLPAFCCGVMWAIGNLGSVFATQYLGLAVGFSLTQVCLIVAGVWAIVLLKELKGFIPIGLWGISALVVLGGAVLLSIF